MFGAVVDNRTVSICATGHNSVHLAINTHEKTGQFPPWCVGATRELAEEALRLRDGAQEAILNA
jgi:hypothetical protein